MSHTVNLIGSGFANSEQDTKRVTRMLSSGIKEDERIQQENSSTSFASEFKKVLANIDILEHSVGEYKAIFKPTEC